MLVTSAAEKLEEIWIVLGNTLLPHIKGASWLMAFPLDELPEVTSAEGVQPANNDIKNGISRDLINFST
jgi:hypothetical protein